MNETDLQAILQRISLHSLLMVTSKALTRSGYGDVQLLDRRRNKQKSRHGGHELLCHTTIGNLSARVVVKVINDSVRTRMLDELAGVVMRTGADLGLLVTPHLLKAGVRKHLKSYPRARIEVIDGEKLASLLTTYQIGVRSRGGVDYAFFESLEEVSVRLLTFISNPTA